MCPKNHNIDAAMISTLLVKKWQNPNKKRSKFIQIQSNFSTSISQLCDLKSNTLQIHREALFETLQVMLSPSICRPVPCASSINRNAPRQNLASLKLLMPPGQLLSRNYRQRLHCYTMSESLENLEASLQE